MDAQIRIDAEPAAELEVLLRMLARAKREDISGLIDDGLNEAARVYADMIEDALEKQREKDPA